MAMVIRMEGDEDPLYKLRYRSEAVKLNRDCSMTICGFLGVEFEGKVEFGCDGKWGGRVGWRGTWWLAWVGRL
jgi:hypothetical protein